MLLLENIPLNTDPHILCKRFEIQPCKNKALNSYLQILGRNPHLRKLEIKDHDDKVINIDSNFFLASRLQDFKM